MSRRPPGRPPSRPPPSPEHGTLPPTSWTRSSSRCRCRTCPPRAGVATTAGPRRPIWSTCRSAPRRRPSPPAGPPRATSFLEAAIGGLDARRDRVRARPAPRPSRGHPAGSRRSGRGHAGGPSRRRARAAGRLAGTGHGPRHAGPAEDARRHLLRCAAARPGGDPGRPRLRPARGQPGRARHDDARGGARLGQRPERRHRAAPTRPRSARPHSTTPKRSSVSGPT